MEQNTEYKQLLSIFDNIDEVVYVSDPDTYELLYANEACRKRWELKLGEKCHKVLQNLKEPCPFCSNKYIFGENLGKTYVWEFQNKIDKRWYRCIDKAIKWPNGKMVRYEMAIDITEHKKAEEALKENEATLKSILKALPVGVGLVSNRVFLQVNEKMCEMTGYSKEELIGKSSKMLYLTDEDYEYVGRVKYAQLRERGSETMETRWRRKDGSIIDVLVSATVLDSKDLLAGVAFSALDITEQKKVQEAMEKRAQEHEQFYKIARGREERILELKKEVNILLEEFGKEPKYP